MLPSRELVIGGASASEGLHWVVSDILFSEVSEGLYSDVFGTVFFDDSNMTVPFESRESSLIDSLGELSSCNSGVEVPEISDGTYSKVFDNVIQVVRCC